MQAMRRFMLGVWMTPVAVRLWLALLMAMNMAGPLFFHDRFEAQVAFASSLASAMLMMFITARSGFTRLLGLGHAPWVPMMIFVGWRLSTTPIDGVYRTWLISMLVLNGFALLFDGIDVTRWLCGNRDEMVDGLPPCAAARA